MSLMINLATASYPITIESALRFQIRSRLEAMGSRRLAVVTDSTVWALHGEVMTRQLQGFDTHLTILPPGESSKSPENLMQLYRSWLTAGLTRKDLVIAFGGGVIGDLTGYGAATYLRGVPFIQVPTTVLSQVDSSIGGKVAVDLPEGKNLVGTFYHPQEVWIDPDYLKTLPDRIFKDGLAEVIKAGCIADEVLYTLLQNASNLLEPNMLHEMITRSLTVKKHLVEADEKEQGQRKLLNFGHTIGHALEAYGEYIRWTHGEAVAMGMAWITRCSEAAGLSRPGSARELTALLLKAGLPVESEVPLEALMVWLNRDKKKTSKGIELALMKQPGCSFLHEVPQDELENFLSER